MAVAVCACRCPIWAATCCFCRGLDVVWGPDVAVSICACLQVSNTGSCCVFRAPACPDPAEVAWSTAIITSRSLCGCRRQQQPAKQSYCCCSGWQLQCSSSRTREIGQGGSSSSRRMVHPWSSCLVTGCSSRTEVLLRHRSSGGTSRTVNSSGSSGPSSSSRLQRQGVHSTHRIHRKTRLGRCSSCGCTVQCGGGCSWNGTMYSMTS